jgi:hypothetical protein
MKVAPDTVVYANEENRKPVVEFATPGTRRRNVSKGPGSLSGLDTTWPNFQVRAA